MSVHIKEPVDLPLNLTTMLADVVAQKMQAAVHHHLYSTRTSANVFAHKESRAQLVKLSATKFVIVFAKLGNTVLHLRNLIKIPVNANALSSRCVQAHKNSINKPASVSVLTLVLAAESHKFLTQPAVSVNVQIGQSDAPTHRKSLMNICANVGVPMLE